MPGNLYDVTETAPCHGHSYTGNRRPASKQKCQARLSDVLEQVWALKTPIMILVAFAAPLPLPLLVDSSEARCAYVLAAMAILWMTEAVPIPVTALLPVVLFPVFGVLTAVEVANSYMGNTSLLFIGGLMVAIAVEESGLHRRVALGVIKFVGSDPKWIMLGLMLPTWFLSMWISNTATASMMIPIVEAILTQLQTADVSGGAIAGDVNKPSSGPQMSVSVVPGHCSVKKLASGQDDVTGYEESVHPAHEHESVCSDTSRSVDSKPGLNEEAADVLTREAAAAAEHKKLCKGLSISIAYAANVGGIATLTGTPPNLVLAGQADFFFRKFGGESGVSFLRWMLMALPLSLLMLALCWAWLVLVYMRGTFKRQSKDSSDAVQRVLQNAYKSLGKITYAEIQTLVCFVVLALLWLCRDPKFLPGWSVLFREGYTSDSTAAVFVSLLFFVLPARKPTVFCWRYQSDIRQKPSYTPLLTWQVAQAKMPWGIIILLGGGFALAKGCKFAGLSDWFGEQLSTFQGMDPWLINLVISIVVAMATEITSNTATATLLMPIMAELAIRVKVNPLYFMSSAALATSFAFMLPVATPPNAIVFAHGHLRIADMASVGCVMNAIAVGSLTLAVNTWGSAIFGFNEMPEVFRQGNVTAVMKDI